ncbi:MAG: cyclic nucleotide-binding domain-containing protein [Verrucomicrobia bacterium]|nr:cyclic nucleotide-binding domain-containing protein [Verrucomicrobiota bacterium]
MNTYAEILRDNPLFRRLPRRGLAQLGENATQVEFRKGSTIVRDGDPADALHVILSGRCETVVSLASGNQHLVDVYGPGSIFDERAILSRDRVSATVRVLTDCVVLRLPAADVRDVMQRYPVFEKELIRRVYGHYRALRHGPATEKLGRIAVVRSVAQRLHGSDVLRNVASALRATTGRSVLFCDVVRDGTGLSLSDWRKLPPCSLEELRSVAEVHKSSSGVWELPLRARGDGTEAESVAPILSHLARYARYLLLHLDPSVPDPLALQLLMQSDLPYLLFGQRAEDTAAVRAFGRVIAEHPSRELVRVLPLVCLEPGERAMAQDVLAERTGLPVHGVLESLPPGEAEPRAHYARHPGDRCSVRVRQLAREIGRCRIGLALSSGGAKSLAHIGVIQVLEENGIDADVVAGTSMGSMIAALWAFGLNGQEIAKIAMRNERPWALLGLVDPVFPPRRGFIRGGVVPRIVRDAIGDVNFADMLRQLRVVATDLDTLERVVFDSGPVVPVVHASMAMPGIVVPVRHGGRTLVDGGVAEPLPVNVLTEMGVDRILAVNTIPNPEDMKQCILTGAASNRENTGPLQGVLDRYVNYFARGNILDIWAKSMHGAETRVAEEACKLADVVLRPISCEGRWHDFGRPARYIALGRQVAEAALPEIRGLMR